MCRHETSSFVSSCAAAGNNRPADQRARPRGRPDRSAPAPPACAAAPGFGAFFIYNKALVLYHNKRVQNVTHTSTFQRDTEGQLSITSYTKDPATKENYRQAMKIFCAPQTHRLSPALSSADAMTAGAGNRRREHRDQKKLHRTQALK